MRLPVQLLLGLALIAANPCAAAQQAASPTAPTNLRVATWISPPYSLEDSEGELRGLAPWMWRRVAQRVGVEFSIKVLTREEVQQGLADGTVDVGIGAVHLTTAQHKQVNHTLPYDSPEIAVAVRPGGSRSPLGALGHIWGAEVLLWLGTLLAATVLFGLAYYIVERPRREGAAAQGRVSDALWWSIVTMSTVGYGDNVPRSGRGRLVGVVWMVLAMVLSSLFGAVLASRLTVGRLQEDEDSRRVLATSRVGVANDSDAAATLSRLGINSQVLPANADLLGELTENRIDALVDSSSALRYLRRQAGGDRITILDEGLGEWFVGFALRRDLGPDLVERVNDAILEVVETPEWIQYRHSLLGAEPRSGG